MTDSDDAWIDHLQAKDKCEPSRNRIAEAIPGGKAEQDRNRRLAATIAKAPLDDETEHLIRAYVKANLDVPGPRVGQLLAELDRLRGQ